MDSADATGDDWAGQGFFDGFEAYLTPSTGDYLSALTAGLVIPDTNVLLNLYRYKPEARDSLLDVLRSIGDRLWVPHRVVEEFWGARESVLRDPRSTAATTDELTDLRDRALQVFRTWANRVSLGAEESRRLQSLLQGGFDGVMEGIAQLDDDGAREYIRDTASDPVLQALERILAGRVGRPQTPAELESALAEGRRRTAQRIPPGYKDGAKGGDAASGDYLVWSQILAEAGERKCDVLFVTADVKEDWWRRVQGQPRGPRPELVREMRDVARCRLFMLRPDGLLEHARKVLSVDVSASSVEDVGRVERLLEEENLGWTADAVVALLERLAGEAPVQGRVIRRAAELGGFIPREEVYEIGEYEQERSLRGFTRPVRRITQRFQDLGLIPSDVGDLLVTEYDEQSPLGMAIGFSVPSDAIPLILPEPRPTVAPDASDAPAD
jgi:hypothetical protein